jgi:hypothetical protein
MCRHNFYHTKVPQSAVDRQQFYEYTRGFVTWLEYRPDA